MINVANGTIAEYSAGKLDNSASPNVAKAVIIDHTNTLKFFFCRIL